MADTASASSAVARRILTARAYSRGMPRKHRSARERSGPPPAPDRPTSDAPAWALAAGMEVRAVSSEQTYRCPGCDHEIRPRTAHLVVITVDAPEERRHWHRVCSQQERRATRR